MIQNIRFSFYTKRSMLEQLLREEVERLVKSKISKAELASAKQKEVEYIKEMRENLGFQWSRTELLGEGLLFTDQPDFYLTRLEMQAKMKAKDLRKVAKKWLDTAPFRILFLSHK